MRKFFDVILFLAVLCVGVFTYLYYEEVVLYTKQFIYGKPCEKPITYFVNQLDSRFKLSRDEAKKIVRDAAEKWNEAYGKILFEEKDHKGKVTVDFVFDERQMVTESLGDIGLNLDRSESSLNNLKEQYESKKNQYSSLKISYDQSLLLYETNQNKYLQLIKDISRNRKSSGFDMGLVSEEKKKLEKQYTLLQDLSRSLGELAVELNSLASQINIMVKDHNQIVGTYNETAGRLPREFEEGEFVLEKGDMYIYIYQFEDKNALSRVLQHEFGHALGLDHVLTNEEAIMYPYNSGSTLVPTTDDMNELIRVCEVS